MRIGSAEYLGYATRQIETSGDGPPVLFIHGFGDSADTWRYVMHRLAIRGRRCVAVDLPGFGDAAPLRPGGLLPQLDDFVGAVVTHHGAAEDVILVGNSLGGLLTVRAAADQKLPIKAILPIGTAGVGWTRLLQVATVGNLAAVKLSSRLPLPAWFARKLTAVGLRRMMYGNWRSADQKQIRIFTERLSARPVLETALTMWPEVTAATKFAPVTCPTTILHGGRDRLVSLASARQLHQLIPRSRLVVLPDSGHCPQLDAPRTVATLITQFSGGSAGFAGGAA